MALWTKTSDKGKFQAGKVSDFRQREEGPGPHNFDADDEGDVPF